MDLSLTTFTQSPFGRIVYKPIQRLVHYARRRIHPDVPCDHAIIKAFYRKRPILIEVHRWNRSDSWSIEQCFKDAQYDMPSGVHGTYLEGVYRAILTSGKKPLIVDCGANIGASVLWFSARYPEAQVVAIEPAAANFALLRKNCRDRNIEIRQAGIGPVDGTAWMSDSNVGGMGCRTYDCNEGVEVEILSLATLLASKPDSEFVPFLLKVDIEGAEKSLFSGDTALINQFPLIVLEPHDWMLPGQQTSVEFFRFHAQAGREFAMKHENVASISYRSSYDS